MTRLSNFIKEDKDVEVTEMVDDNKLKFINFLKEETKSPSGAEDDVGTGVPPEEKWKTPEQMEQDEKDKAAMQKDKDEQEIQAGIDKEEDRYNLLRSKLGRLFATPEELDELDKEKEEEEKAEIKKTEKEKKENITETALRKTLKNGDRHQSAIDQAHSMNLRHVGHGNWADSKGDVKGKIVNDKFIPIEKGDVSGEKGNTSQPVSKVKNLVNVMTSAEKQKKIEKGWEKRKEELDNKRKERLDIGDNNGDKKKAKSQFQVINGRNKVLDQNIKTSKQSVFTEKLYNPMSGDNDFYEKAKKFEKKDLTIENNWKPLAFLMNGKVPNREVQIFTRMMNTKRMGNAKPPISFFTEGKIEAGKGTTASQAGELMTMMCVTMNDLEKKEFNDSVRSHLQDNPNVVVDESWLNAALNNTKAIHKKLEKDYNVDNASSIITHACWDSTDEIEALGLDDPKKNKGGSTDIYVKVKSPDGVYKLHEISLKKSKKANFTNSGVTKLKTWSKEPMPKEIDPEIQGKKQLKLLSETVRKHTTKISNILNSGSRAPIVTALRKKLGNDNIKDFLHGSNINARATLATALYACAENDRECKDVVENLKKQSKDYSKRVIKAIRDYPDYQKGMINSIRKDFPVKACAENEEMMAIGNMVLDRRVVNKIFGTSSWKNIKEHITAVTEGKKHYLAYQAGEDGKIVHIANVIVREDRIMYGGTWKFELTMADKFTSALSKANKEIFGESIEYINKLDNLLLEDEDDLMFEETEIVEESKIRTVFETPMEEDD